MTEIGTAGTVRTSGRPPVKISCAKRISSNANITLILLAVHFNSASRNHKSVMDNQIVIGERMKRQNFVDACLVATRASLAIDSVLEGTTSVTGGLIAMMKQMSWKKSVKIGNVSVMSLSVSPMSMDLGPASRRNGYVMARRIVVTGAMSFKKPAQPEIATLITSSSAISGTVQDLFALTNPRSVMESNIAPMERMRPALSAPRFNAQVINSGVTISQLPVQPVLTKPMSATTLRTALIDPMRWNQLAIRSNVRWMSSSANSGLTES